MFRGDDDFARRQGWRIEPGRFGLSRTYRNPDFDRLAGCAECRGAGASGDGTRCERCSGTGRLETGGRILPAGRPGP